MKRKGKKLGLEGSEKIKKQLIFRANLMNQYNMIMIIILSSQQSSKIIDVIIYYCCLPSLCL